MDVKIDWRLCCLCQDREKTSDMRQTPHGWESLGKQLILFNNSQLKIPDAFVGFTEEDELAEFLKSNNAWYHHNCYLDYSNS